MRSRLTQLLAVVGAVTILVLAANTVAMATTGRSFLLGTTNRAAAATTLQRTSPGPALQLQTKTNTSPPFTTNAGGKVANLNADRLDGKSAYQVERKSQTHIKTQNVRSSQAAKTFDVALPVLATDEDVFYAYDVTLAGASGNSACVVRVHPDPVAFTDYGPSSSTAAQPILTGFASFFAEDSGVDLHCTSDTPFTVSGAVTTILVPYLK